MKSSFSRNDVSLLLKDITGMVKPMGATQREKEIQSGRHYCEMLPREYKPTEKYVEIYEHVLKVFAQPTADAVVKVSEMIYQHKNGNIVLVSLVRAGDEVLSLIEAGKINTEPLITHTFPLNEIDKAYHIFENKLDKVIKIAIEC